MIGNTIKFRNIDSSYNVEELEGLVVDAFTDISGKNETFLGIGGGETKSRRMYKVMHYRKWDLNKSFSPSFTDIRDTSLISIIAFANNNNQETNEEKLKK